MAEPIEFYFDFSSPYGYLGACQIEEVAARAGREVTWKPILLGVAFKETGGQPLLQIPLKGDYAYRDITRTARRLGIAAALPPDFPFLSVAPARAFYSLCDADPGTAKAFALRLYRRAFGEGRPISSIEAVVTLAAEEGLDAEALRAAMARPAAKDRLRAEVQSAIDKGVFGSPYFVADGEPFWGHDRLPDLEQWLRTGGW